MNATVAQLARLVDGNVVGDGDLAISSARTLDEAGPSDVSFLDGDKYLPKLLRSRAGAVVVPAAFEGEGRTFIRVADPLAAFVTLYRFLHAIHEPKPSGVDARAAVHPTAVVGVDASIAPLAHIGEHSVVGARCRIGAGVSIGAGCVLGDDVTVYANAVLYERTVVGNRVIIHAGAVIGADGFGYRMKGGRHNKVPQLGNVVIADDVEIGANATVDRATFGSTTIGEGSKIDNLVQVGHNCTIGRHNIFVAQVGFGGSCTTGDYVIVAGQAGIADHINVGSKAIINPKAGVGKDVPPGQRASGTPAMDWNDHLRQIWATGRLPRLMRDIKAIKQNLGIADET